jgi:hypothetical protein
MKRTGYAILCLGWGMAFLFLCGCAEVRDSTFPRIAQAPTTEPFRVAVLPATADAALLPENLEPERPWYVRIFDGRGTVVGSLTPAEDARTSLIATLSQTRKYQRVFPAETREKARALGADRVILLTVHDYRAVNAGGNVRYGLVLVLAPLMPQYWIRWMTMEARIDWELEVQDAATGARVSLDRRQAVYARTMRYAWPRYLYDKMLTFLVYEASPKYVCEAFQIVAPSPEDHPASAGEPAPSPAAPVSEAAPEQKAPEAKAVVAPGGKPAPESDTPAQEPSRQ